MLFFKNSGLRLVTLLSSLAVCAPLALADEIIVSGAASLTNAFKEVAEKYEQKYPGSKVTLNFGASGTLLQQMAKGAPVDVFASADQATMDKALAQELIATDTRKDFVSNTLVLIVPKESKLSISALTDLKGAKIKRIAVGNPEFVPIGNYSKNILEKEKIWTDLQEKIIPTQNVRQSLDYVSRGEVDVGFVYGSDAYIGADKTRIAFIVPLEAPIRYPIARTTSSKNAKEADQFIDYVLSPEGQEIIVKYGFSKP